MAKFKFSLEPLKRIRANRYDIAKREMFEVQRNMQELELELSKSQLQQRECLDNLVKSESGQKIVAEQSLHELARMREKKQKKDILMAGLELERQKRWLAELKKDLKIIERLEEKKKHEYLKQLKVLEQKRADQWTSQTWARKRIMEEQKK